MRLPPREDVQVCSLGLPVTDGWSIVGIRTRDLCTVVPLKSLAKLFNTGFHVTSHEIYFYQEKQLIMMDLALPFP